MLLDVHFVIRVFMVFFCGPFSHKNKNNTNNNNKWLYFCFEKKNTWRKGVGPATGAKPIIFIIIIMTYKLWMLMKKSD